jgi:hypothetical protein
MRRMSDRSEKPGLWKRLFAGGTMAFIGFMLSPLSWWNDAVVNLPLAYAFGWVISLAYKPAFEPGMIVGYWLTNVAGFVLMHKGGQKMIQGESAPYSWRILLRDVGISLIYTALIVVLIHFKIIQPFQDYFQANPNH